MKKICIILWCIGYFLSSMDLLAEEEADKDYYTMDEIIHLVRTRNFNVRANAETVYQARMQIRVTMGLLIPRLNFTTSLFVLLGGVLDLVPQMIGFIYPNTWFMWEQYLFLFDAQRHMYTSLIANGINAVEGMCYKTHALMMTLKVYEQFLVENTDYILRIIEQMVNKGVLKPLAITMMKTTRQLLVYDIEQLKYQIANANINIADALGLSNDEAKRFALAPIAIPDLTAIQPVEVDVLQRAAIAASHDLQAYNFLVDAAKAGVYKNMFEFVSPTAFTIFSGFGFGYSSYLNIGKSQVILMQTRREELVQNTNNAVVIAVNEYNIALKNYLMTLELKDLSTTGLSMLIAEIENGGIFDAASFMELLNANLSAQTRAIANQHSYLIARAQLDRLTWRKSYYKDILETLVPNATSAERDVSGLLRQAERVAGDK